MRKFVGIRQFVILVLLFTCLGLSRKYCIHTCDCMLWDRRVVLIHLQLETERDHLILILPTDPFGIATFFLPTDPKLLFHFLQHPRFVEELLTFATFPQETLGGGDINQGRGGKSNR